MVRNAIVIGGGQVGCESAVKLVASKFDVILVDSGGREVVLDWAIRCGINVYKDCIVDSISFKSNMFNIVTRSACIQSICSEIIIVAVGSETCNAINGLTDLVGSPGLFFAGGVTTPMICQNAAESGTDVAEKVIEWQKNRT